MRERATGRVEYDYPCASGTSGARRAASTQPSTNERRRYISSAPSPRLACAPHPSTTPGLGDPVEGPGCHNLTVVQVQRPLTSADPSQQHYSMELAEPVVAEFKLELVSADDLADSLVDIIAKAAHTGQPEAGWILPLIHLSEPTRPYSISSAVFCLKKKNINNKNQTAAS